MYVHIYIYMYICTYICTYIHIYTYTLIYMYIYTCIHIYICMYIHTYMYTHTHMYIYTYIHIHTHTQTHTYTYIYIYIPQPTPAGGAISGMLKRAASFAHGATYVQVYKHFFFFSLRPQVALFRGWLGELLAVLMGSRPICAAALISFERIFDSVQCLGSGSSSGMHTH